MRSVKVTCQSVTDCTRSIPSPLEDRHLRTVEVHYEGWYVDTALEQVGELALTIFDFLPDMLVEQKVMIMNVHGRERGGMI